MLMEVIDDIDANSTSSVDGGHGIRSSANKFLLPPIAQGKTKTIVLDMDNTLLNASPICPQHYDFIVHVPIHGKPYTPFYVQKRPEVDRLLEELQNNNYEIVIFTAASDCYASPTLDALDPKKLIHHRLYGDSCTEVDRGNVKDLAKLGRDLRNVFIVDDNPNSYLKQPQNAFPIKKFKGDIDDRELSRLIEFCKIAPTFEDVRDALRTHVGDITAGTALNSVNFRNRKAYGYSFGLSLLFARRMKKLARERRQRSSGLNKEDKTVI